MQPNRLYLKTDKGSFPVKLMQKTREGSREVQCGVRTRQIISGPPVNPETDHVADLISTPGWQVAHRLLGTSFPEHTMRGLDAALQAGFKAVEFSTYRTKDGVFVGSHDWTTERTTGVRHEIWNTDWSIIKSLSQAGGPMIRLEDLISKLPSDVVIFLDHKATSSKAENNAGDLQSETALFDHLEKLLPENAMKRVVWKCFAEASSAERARAKGYRVNCMLYPHQIEAADMSRWDIIGMEWSAPESAWSRLSETGKPIIAHIITSQSHKQRAREKGAQGFMVSTIDAVS